MAPFGRLFRRQPPDVPNESRQAGDDRLVLVSESGQREYRLSSGGVLRIGRHPDNDVILDDALVSRWHATMWRDDGHYYLRDEGSVNGLLLNGRTVGQAVEVSIGDRIEIGEAVLFLLASQQSVPAFRRSGSEVVRERGDRSGAAPGRQLGDYRVIREVGRGGMCTVYMAESSRYPGPVALKVPNPSLLADGELMAKFSQEAEIGQTLRHDHIVRIHELSLGSNPPYMVMEYVDGGRTLADRLAETGRLPVADSVSITAQVAEALGYAHKRDIIHRDIKPGNILMAPGDVAKVIDFGIAKVLTRSTLTSGGTMWGTYRYMSTEQAQGDPVDARSDLYSLGVVLYEMLVGEPPFVAANPWEVVHAHIHERPVPPSRHNPSVPADVERVVLTALEKDPRHRYQSAEELLADLAPERWAGRQPRLPQLASARLVIENGEYQGTEILLPASGVVLSRSLLDPNDPTISRQHARIQCRQGAYWLEDSGSTNGTFVYDESRQAYELVEAPVALRCGDRLRVGGTVMLFSC